MYHCFISSFNLEGAKLKLLNSQLCFYDFRTEKLLVHILRRYTGVKKLSQVFPDTFQGNNFYFIITAFKKTKTEIIKFNALTGIEPGPSN